MQSSLNWLQIRPLNSSQQEGFEELVCQLARYEKVPEGSVFQRKGKPDGGVECFWIYPDGTEWGWQAKFFTNSPTSTQWGEVKDSVKSFLTTHPKMTKYTVCFPIDLPDGRVKGQQSAREKWDEYVMAWQKEKKINFEYWGSSELWNRLSLEEHQGRLSFWFSDQTIFTPKWFSNQIEETIANVGPRYTPEANVDLPTRVLCFEITKPKSQPTRAGCSLAKSWANTWVGELPC